MAFISERGKGVSLALLAGLFWGTNALFSKWVEGLTPLGLALGRLIFAWVFLTVGLIIFGKLSEVFRAAGSWRWWLGVGALAGVHWLFIMLAFIETSAGNAAMLGNLTPLFLLGWGPLVLKESLRPREVGVALFTVLGVGLLLMGKEEGFQWDTVSLKGDSFAILAAFLFSIYTLLIRKNQHQYPFYVLMFWVFIYAGLTLWSFGFLFHWSFFEPHMIWSEISWGWLILLGLVGTALGHCFYSASLRWLPSSTASLLSLLSPVSAYGWGWLFLGETVGLVSLVGLFITLMGLGFILITPAQVQGWFLRRKKEHFVVPEGSGS